MEPKEEIIEKMKLLISKIQPLKTEVNDLLLIKFSPYEYEYVHLDSVITCGELTELLSWVKEGCEIRFISGHIKLPGLEKASNFRNIAVNIKETINEI